jgi:hypothetical protein
MLLPLMIARVPLTPQKLGFQLTTFTIREYCNDYKYKRVDGELNMLHYRHNGNRHAFWTPKGSRFNVWSYQTRDAQNLMEHVAQRVGWR